MLFFFYLFIEELLISIIFHSGEVYSIQHYVIQFVSDLRYVSSFLRVLAVSFTNKTDRPPKIRKNIIFWCKIVIFHTKYPKNFRASLRNWKKYDFLS